MKKIEYILRHEIPDEVLKHRFNAFNEKHGFYYNSDTALEPFDLIGFHLLFYIDGEFAGATRLTETPGNFMTVNLKSDTLLPTGRHVIEMGRTFVIPKYRGFKLLTSILLIGLNLCEKMGYKTVVGSESHLDHLKMPISLGFEFNNIYADLSFPGKIKGLLSNELVIVCELEKSIELRKQRTEEFTKFMAEKGYELIIS